MNYKLKTIAHWVIACFLISLSPLGCTIFDEKVSTSPTEIASVTDAQVFVGDTIEMNYDPNVIMKRAESFHEGKGYSEAIVEYQHFLDLHGNHMLAAYAQYRLALSHFKMIQTVDRDMSPVQKAQDAFLKLIETYPGSPYEAEARVKIKESKNLIAEHHLLVAKYYYRQGAYLAATKRFNVIVNSYPSWEKTAEVKYELAKTYKNMGAAEWSRDWAIALVREHPEHHLRKDGFILLTALQKENPNLVVEQNLGPINQNSLASGVLKMEPTPSFFPGSLAPINGNSPRPADTTKVAIKAKSSIADCGFGSWCETSGTLQSPAISRSSSSIPTCRPGTWCE